VEKETGLDGKSAHAADSAIEERDPHGTDPHSPGAKLDAGKAAIMQGFVEYFPNAIEAVASISDYGAKQYSWGGWLSVPDGINRYSDAMMRHVVKEKTEGDFDRKTGLFHAAQVAWNAMARLELMIRIKAGPI
jgi:hypothetical protein